MNRTITLDCEFVPNRLDPSGLVSIGMTDGTSHFYGVNAEMDFDAVMAWKTPWMRDNVVRHLPVGPDGRLHEDHPDVYSYAALRGNVQRFFEIGGHRSNQRLYMNCGAQDMIRPHTLWGNDWSEMPDCIPHRFRDMGDVFDTLMINEDDLPRIDPFKVHHAFHDADHDFKLLRHLGVAA